MTEKFEHDHEKESRPRTFEECYEFVKGIQGDKAKDFFTKVADVKLDEAMPLMGTAILIKSDDERMWGIFTSEEIEEMEPEERQYTLQDNIRRLLINKAVLENSTDYYLIRWLMKRDQLGQYLKDYIETIWQNKGKDKPNFPEKQKCDQLQEIYQTGLKKFQEFSPDYDPDKKLSSDMNTVRNFRRNETFERELNRFGGRASVIFDYMGRGDILARSIQLQYQTISQLTKDLDRDDLAVLFTEAIEKNFMYVGAKRKNDPDVIDWHKKLKKTTGEAMDEWAAQK